MTRSRRELISIIVPVFNEEENVERAHAAIVSEFESRSDLDFEIIFTDNHSTDGTFERLRSIATRDGRVRVIRFTRNFGFNRSILTGYRHARGDAAIQIDADLEDPPQVFHQFIDLWRQGHDVVVGVRAHRPEGRLLVLARRIFYSVLDRVSESNHEVDAGDFRLVDRAILDQLRVIEDAQPYVRGLTSALARSQGRVEYARSRREFGQSKFPFRQLLRLAMQGVYAHSTLPLKIATYLGVLIAVLTAFLSAAFLFGRLMWPETWPTGFATTTLLILFGISLNGLFLGIIGEYIARIYEQVRYRPTVVVEKAVNIELSGAIYTDERRRGLQ